MKRIQGKHKRSNSRITSKELTIKRNPGNARFKIRTDPMSSNTRSKSDHAKEARQSHKYGNSNDEKNQSRSSLLITDKRKGRQTLTHANEQPYNNIEQRQKSQATNAAVSTGRT